MNERIKREKILDRRIKRGDRRTKGGKKNRRGEGGKTEKQKDGRTGEQEIGRTGPRPGHRNKPAVGGGWCLKTAKVSHWEDSPSGVIVKGLKEKSYFGNKDKENDANYPPVWLKFVKT